MTYNQIHIHFKVLHLNQLYHISQPQKKKENMFSTLENLKLMLETKIHRTVILKTNSK